jgi:hypothetical protein
VNKPYIVLLKKYGLEQFVSFFSFFLCLQAAPPFFLLDSSMPPFSIGFWGRFMTGVFIFERTYLWIGLNQGYANEVMLIWIDGGISSKGEC